MVVQQNFYWVLDKEGCGICLCRHNQASWPYWLFDDIVFEMKKWAKYYIYEYLMDIGDMNPLLKSIHEYPHNICEVF